MQNEYCTYLYDKESKLLYISFSFEDLTDLNSCENYFIISVYTYPGDSKSIQDLVDYCKGLDEQESTYDTIRRIYGSEVDESTGQEIVGGNICIEDVDIL